MRRLHVIPTNDFSIHNAQDTCWCHPTETSQSIFVHNAEDCREAKERATGTGCPYKEWVIIGESVKP